jgi:RimJ/RimL family protein N-acetyltransferase
MVHRLRDGTRVRLRLIGPDDRETLRRGFDHLSPESRYRRFFTAMPKLPESVLDRLCATDGWNHVAIGAERLSDESAPATAVEAEPGAAPAGEGGREAALPDGVGVARFVRLADHPDVAEAAVVVVDELQGRGLGTLLLGSLTTAARLRGIAHFRAEVLPENQPMRELLQRFNPDAAIEREAEVLVYDLALPPTEDASQPAAELLRGMLRLAAQGLRIVVRKLEDIVSP